MYTAIFFVVLGLYSFIKKRNENSLFFLLFSLFAALLALVSSYWKTDGAIPSVLLTFGSYGLMIASIIYVKIYLNVQVNNQGIVIPFLILFIIRAVALLVLGDNPSTEFSRGVNSISITIIAIASIIFLIYAIYLHKKRASHSFNFNVNFFRAFYISSISYALIFLSFPRLYSRNINIYLMGLYIPFLTLFFLSLRKVQKYPSIELYKRAIETVRDGYIILDRFGDIKYVSSHFQEPGEKVFKEEDNLFSILGVDMNDLSDFESLASDYLYGLEFTNVRIKYLEEDTGDLENILISLNHPKLDIKRTKQMEERTANIEEFISSKEDEFVLAKNRLEDEYKLNKSLNQELLRLRNIDKLTGLLNVKAFRYELELAIDEFPRLAVFLVNIDDFSLVNSYRGHAAGDELLCKVANRISKQLGDEGVLARGQADEFLAFKPYGHINEIEEVSNSILRVFKKSFRVKGDEIEVGVSIGISVSPEDSRDVFALISYANIALREMRLRNKNSYHFYNQRISESIEKDLRLVKELVSAADNRKIVLYYQFQVDSLTGKIVGKEALMRWKHDKWGVIPATEFIDVAEKFGLLRKLDNWALLEACRQNKLWVDAGSESAVSVNVSKRRYEETDLYNSVKEALAVSGLQPEYLELEMSEDFLAEDLDHALESLNALKELGVRIVIDNFGLEYSSLSYLKILPIDKIKISSVFVEGIEKNTIDEAIIDAIIILGKKAGFDLLAQGVERHSQMVYLRERGLDHVQGFYYFEPIDVEVIEEYNLLANN